MADLEQYQFKEDSQKICGETVPSIVEDFVEDYPSIVDRFYTRYYSDHPIKQTEPHQVLFHSNRICLIGIAPEHEAFRRGIKSISFEVGKVDRSQNHVSGKKKSGGMIVQADSTLALITCNDGSVFKVRSCVQGKLVEVNHRVVQDVNLLAKEGEGYIAIVMPKPEQCDIIKGKLITREQFESANVKKISELK
ncbi:protein Abitram [Malaya genurostris]|uniref:protein Abitram n=1 Tax=Malaya genurostris TaxID=325434 RepID=UPI0026F3C50D|nr:protein Abitram [Malaya genurostris]